MCEEQLSVKSEQKKLLRTSAFCLSTVTSLPVLVTRSGVTPSWSLLFWFMYLQKPLLFFFVPLAKSSYSLALAFLTPFLHSLPISLYSSQVTCSCFYSYRCIIKMQPSDLKCSTLQLVLLSSFYTLYPPTIQVKVVSAMHCENLKGYE